MKFVGGSVSSRCGTKVLRRWIANKRAEKNFLSVILKGFMLIGAKFILWYFQACWVNNFQISHSRYMHATGVPQSLTYYADWQHSLRKKYQSTTISASSQVLHLPHPPQWLGWCLFQEAKWILYWNLLKWCYFSYFPSLYHIFCFPPAKWREKHCVSYNVLKIPHLSQKVLKVGTDTPLFSDFFFFLAQGL